jgi:hypothetical protein
VSDIENRRKRIEFKSRAAALGKEIMTLPLAERLRLSADFLERGMANFAHQIAVQAVGELRKLAAEKKWSGQ